MENQEITAQLIDELEKISTANHLPLERRLIDTAIWFHRNRHYLNGVDVPRRLDFLEKTLDIFMEIFALTLQRLQQAEGRGKSENLWLPRGMTGMGRSFGG